MYLVSPLADGLLWFGGEQGLGEHRGIVDLKQTPEHYVSLFIHGIEIKWFL